MAAFEVFEHIGADDRVEGPIPKRQILRVEVECDVGVLAPIHPDVLLGLCDQLAKRGLVGTRRQEPPPWRMAAYFSAMYRALPGRTVKCAEIASRN